MGTSNWACLHCGGTFRPDEPDAERNFCPDCTSAMTLPVVPVREIV